MANGAKRKPSRTPRLVAPMSLVAINFWDMFQAAVEASDAPEAPEHKPGADAPDMREEAADRKRAGTVRRRKRPDRRGATAED